jgi:hypothetical protein
MSLLEETIEATLESDGHLELNHKPQLAPGPVQVTIRSMSMTSSKGGLADLLRELAAEQRARGFAGLSPAELHQFDVNRQNEDEERDLEQESAR